MAHNQVQIADQVDVRFGSKADICSAPAHVRFTPDSDSKSGLLQRVMSAYPPKAVRCNLGCPLWAKSGLMQCSKEGRLFDHLIGAVNQRGRHSEPERLSGFEVDDQFELYRHFDRQFAWLLSTQDAVGI